MIWKILGHEKEETSNSIPTLKFKSPKLNVISITTKYNEMMNVNSFTMLYILGGSFPLKTFNEHSRVVK